MNELPGYIWNTKARYYKGIETKRPVRRQDILELLSSILSVVEQRLGCYARSYYEGCLDADFFCAIVTRELSNLHFQVRALGLGGFDNLTPSDVTRIEFRLRDDLNRFLSLISSIVAAGVVVTLAQLLGRIHMYIGSARIEFWEAERSIRRPSSSEMVIIERRVLTPSEHCDDCISLYNRGWCIQGELPVPGDGSTACMSNDRCLLISQEVLYSELDSWLGTLR